jgi:hypothetical protein
MEHEEAFDRLTEELEPYHALLRHGRVEDCVANPDEWRAEIRKQARHDKIAMRSFTLGRTPDGLYRVWAGRSQLVDEELSEVVALMSLQREASDRAELLGHEEVRWLQARRGEEAAGRCCQCGGRIYVNRLTSPPVIEGDVFESCCY